MQITTITINVHVKCNFNYQYINYQYLFTHANFYIKCNEFSHIYLQFLEKYFNLRTKAGHNHHCRQIELNPELSIAYGVKRKSILCDSQYFMLLMAPMHDVLEGVLQYECKEMLKLLINQEKTFTLELLNNRIQLFDYGYMYDKDKPSPIQPRTLASENNSLKQKGIILLSFIIHTNFRYVMS